MQSLGNFTQSVTQRNLSYGIQPIGGVLANPFSSPSTPQKLQQVKIASSSKKLQSLVAI